MSAIDLLQKNPATLKIITLAIRDAAAGFSKSTIQVGSPKIDAVERPNLTSIGVIRYDGGQTFSLELIFGWSGSFGDDSDPFRKQPADLPAEILNVAFGTIDPQFRGLGIPLKSSFPKYLQKDEIEELLKQIKNPGLSMVLDANGFPLWLELFPGGAIPQNWRYTPTGKS